MLVKPQHWGDKENRVRGGEDNITGEEARVPTISRRKMKTRLGTPRRMLVIAQHWGQEEYTVKGGEDSIRGEGEAVRTTSRQGR